MKRLIHPLLCTLLAGGLLAAQEAGDRRVLEEIVARVNNSIITLSDLEQSRQLLRQELSQRYAGAELELEFEKQQANLLRDLIDQNLLIQRGNDMGISVEPQVIKRLDTIRQEMGLGTMEDLERAVAAQGLSFEDFRQQLRDQMLTQMVIQREVAGRVMVDSEKVRDYYLRHREELARPERYRLREILVATEGPPGDGPEGREERVREILGKIRKGEDFTEVARTYSDAPTAAEGGELGYFEKEKLAPAIREVVEKLREAGVSDPLPTRDGWLILQLVEHIAAGIPPFEDVEAELAERLYFGEVQPALREFVSDLRREAYVYVKPGYEDTGAVEEELRPKRRARRVGSVRKRD